MTNSTAPYGRLCHTPITHGFQRAPVPTAVPSSPKDPATQFCLRCPSFVFKNKRQVTYVGRPGREVKLTVCGHFQGLYKAVWLPDLVEGTLAGRVRTLDPVLRVA